MAQTSNGRALIRALLANATDQEIASPDGDVTSKIASATKIVSSAVDGYLRRMQDDGEIEREVKGRRTYRVKLTAKGQQRLTESAEQQAEAIAESATLDSIEALRAVIAKRDETIASQAKTAVAQTERIRILEEELAAYRQSVSAQAAPIISELILRQGELKKEKQQLTVQLEEFRKSPKGAALRRIQELERELAKLSHRYDELNESYVKVVREHAIEQRRTRTLREALACKRS